MHVVAVQREVRSGGVEAQGVFAISARNQAHIMSILREGLYTDRVLAVLREYSANAWDAHRTSGKADLPIKVTLPTDMNPTLVIRDWGTGMSEEDIFGVFTQYGESTKREDDTAVGCLGVGSKSGFAYSDSFTVISYHGGMKKTYVAVLDQSDIGTMSRLNEEPCGDEVGIEIQVPVKRKDIWEFENKAKSLFRYFDPKPEINCTFPSIPRLSLKSGFVMESSGSYEWIAVMGCVPYRININQIQSALDSAGIGSVMSKISGGLYFEIGEVQIGANREELKYTDSTKRTLVEKLSLLFYEYTSSLTKCMKDSSLTDWQKRIEIQKAFCRFQGASALRIPDIARGMTGDQVFLWTKPEDMPKTFTLISPERKSVASMPVLTTTRIVIKDDKRSIKGFDLDNHDYVVRPGKNIDLKDVRTELDKYLTACRMTGIPVLNISSLGFDPEYKKSPRKGWGADCSKYLVRSFQLREPHSCSYHYPWSACWDTVTREPTKDDVFVIFENFLPGGGQSFFQGYQQDYNVIQALGGTMPPVYGYKSTEKKPVSEADCMGTPYSTWVKKYLAELPISDEIREEFENYLWRRALTNPYYGDPLGANPMQVIVNLEAVFGKEHRIPTFVRNYVKSGRNRSQWEAIFSWLSHALERSGTWINPVEAARKEIANRYPLLEDVQSSLRNLWGEKAVHWIDYVSLVDSAR